MGVLDTIKGCPLFFELYDEEIETIVEKCQVLSLENGDFIIKEGDHGNDFFIILSGYADVLKGETKLAELHKGDLFGELVLLNETLRTADIVARTYTDLLVMDYESIFGLYKTNPKIFGLLILNLSRLLTQRLKKSGQDLRALGEKVAQLEAQAQNKKSA